MRQSERVLFDFDSEWPERPTVDLQRLAQALRAQALLVALFAVGVALLVFAVSRTATDRYRATARLVAAPSSLTVSGEPDDDRSLTTALALARTPAVLNQAARAVPGETAASVGDKISTSVEIGAAVIDITATGHDPRRAAALANAVARAFLDQQAKHTREQLARTRAVLAARLDQLGPGGSATAEAAALRRRLGGLAVEEAAAAGNLRLGEPAQAPASPVAPRPARNAIAGFLTALALAVLAVIVREYPRPGWSAAGAADALPVLARFPSERRRGRRAWRDRVAADEEDARRSLLSAVLVALPPGGRQVVLTTSPERREGSARVAAELARALAESGVRTMAFSADILSTVFARAHEAAGGPPAPGRELVWTGAVDAPAWELNAGDHGYVVVDAPGLLTSSEPWLVGRHADAVVLVHPEGISDEEMAAAREALDRMGARVLGAVLVD